MQWNNSNRDGQNGGDVKSQRDGLIQERMSEKKCPTVRFEEIMHDELGDGISLWDVIDDAEVESLDYLVFIQRLEKEFSVTLKDAELADTKHFYELCLLATGIEPALPC